MTICRCGGDNLSYGQKTVVSARAVMEVTPSSVKWRTARTCCRRECGMTVRILLSIMPSTVCRWSRNWWYSQSAGRSSWRNSGSLIQWWICAASCCCHLLWPLWRCSKWWPGCSGMRMLMMPVGHPWWCKLVEALCRGYQSGISDQHGWDGWITLACYVMW